MIGHDPERRAAAYLGGDLDPARRVRFERHLLACRACWDEVQLARAGRDLVAPVRELAPERVTDRVRAGVELAELDSADSPARSAVRRRRPSSRLVAVGALLIVALTGAVARAVLVEPDQPLPIAAAAATFRAAPEPAGGPAAVPPPRTRDLAGFRWRSSASRQLGRMDVAAYSYQNGGGERVLVLRGRQPFPEATDADALARDSMWTTELSGVAMVCLNRPSPYLVLARDRSDVLAAADALARS